MDQGQNRYSRLLKTVLNDSKEGKTDLEFDFVGLHNSTNMKTENKPRTKTEN
jgi:hypothetical protein